jgi:endonuclease YncB( thermonuclease family)
LARLLPPPTGPPRVATSAGGVEVIDGDTLRWPDGRRVRLAAIDTPEVGRPLADEAARFVAEALAGREVALVPPDPPTDRYDRLLADVLVDGRSLSEALVASGLAWLYEPGDAPLLDRQAEAVAARRGVHAYVGRAGPGPFVVTSRRFHRRDCRWIADGLAGRPLEADVASLFSRGLSPCRTCLPWPP